MIVKEEMKKNSRKLTCIAEIEEIAFRFFFLGYLKKKKFTKNHEHNTTLAQTIIHSFRGCTPLPFLLCYCLVYVVRKVAEGREHASTTNPKRPWITTKREARASPRRDSPHFPASLTPPPLV